MTWICYDTEFIEDGRTIELISIGMVAEDGREYYAVDESCNWFMVSHDPWLREHVLPSLPVIYDASGVRFDEQHRDYPALKSRDLIASDIRDFILAKPDPRLWADYCAYDHVVLCQLWGAMIDLPEGVPMWTHDLRQEIERRGSPDVPPMPGAREHNALDDAREVAYRLRWLQPAVTTQETRSGGGLLPPG